MSRSPFRKIRALAALLVLLAWCGSMQAATPSAWKDSGFSINAGSMSLRGVLDEFCRTYGVRLALEVDAERPVKGRLKADSGVEFLNRLAASYKFRWFVYNDTLYVTAASANTSARLEVGEDAVQDAKSALIGLGLFDDRFGWGELPDEGVVIVSGPRSYVELARATLLPTEPRVPRKGRQIMVFRLKYASAMDRVITSRGKSETIPGVKTILSNLLFGPRSAEALTDPRNRINADSSKRSRTPNKGKGEAVAVGEESFVPLFAAPEGSARNRLQPTAGGDSAPRGQAPRSEEAASPRIEADPALNAIMIYDQAGKRELYAALIKELDVQPQQIEIEALIVDIDRSKLSDMGVEWGVRAGAVNSTVNSTMQNSQGLNLPLPGATLLISDVGRFYARLKVMETSGEAKVLATPTVLTLDNVAAVLDLSRSAYVSLVGERVADLADVTAGTMLRVIPRIIHDAGQTRVRLEVDIEDGSLDQQDGGTSGSSGNLASGGKISATVTRSTISTQAIIDEQQTLMIGGYHVESTQRDQQKVPLLGELPLVGGLFRSSTQSGSTRERLFLITPRLTGSDGVARQGALQQGLQPGRPKTGSAVAPVGDASTAPQVAAAAQAAAAAEALAAPAAPRVSLPANGPRKPDSIEIGGGLRLPARKVDCRSQRPLSML